MEDHQLNNFLNQRMQFGELKYKTTVESLLFDQKNQELIKKVYEIFQHHLKFFKILKQNNLQDDHISALVCKRILGDKFVEKKLVSNQFIITIQNLFGLKQYNLALATIKFKNHIVNSIRLSNLKVSAIEEFLNDKEIPIQFDLEETKLFMTKQSSGEYSDFIKNFILYNFSNNESFSLNLKYWKQKFGIQNNDYLKSNIVFSIHLLDWTEQVKQVIERLWMPYCSKSGQFQLADLNDITAFKPLNYISDLYEKKAQNFFLIDSLQSLIKNHQYNFDQIKVSFNHKSSKEILLSFVEILDWCSDIQKWDEIIFQIVENIKLEYLTTQSYQDSFGDGGFQMENYLESILDDVFKITQERVDPQNRPKFINIDELGENQIDGILYEIQKDGLDFYLDEPMICGSVIFNKQQKSRISGKIGQMIMDMAEVQRMNFLINEQNLECFQTLWLNEKLQPQVIKQKLKKYQIDSFKNRIMYKGGKPKVRQI